MAAVDRTENISELMPADVLVCVKDANGKVLSQNAPCEHFCGNQSGVTCTKNCMDYFDALMSGPATAQLEPNQLFDGRRFDLLLLRNDNFVLSLLMPRDTGVGERLSQLKEYGLTSQELLVASLVLQGYRNAEIEQQLHIAPPTLRTHLRHIYRKAPAELFPKRS